jgi:hypothetical protein
MDMEESKPKPTSGNEDGPAVALELTDLLAPREIAQGPARCERKRPPR